MPILIRHESVEPFAMAASNASNYAVQQDQFENSLHARSLQDQEDSRQAAEDFDHQKLQAVLNQQTAEQQLAQQRLQTGTATRIALAKDANATSLEKTKLATGQAGAAEQGRQTRFEQSQANAGARQKNVFEHQDKQQQDRDAAATARQQSTIDQQNKAREDRQSEQRTRDAEKRAESIMQRASTKERQALTSRSNIFRARGQAIGDELKLLEEEKAATADPARLEEIEKRTRDLLTEKKQTSDDYVKLLETWHAKNSGETPATQPTTAPSQTTRDVAPAQPETPQLHFDPSGPTPKLVMSAGGRDIELQYDADASGALNGDAFRDPASGTVYKVDRAQGKAFAYPNYKPAAPPPTTAPIAPAMQNDQYGAAPPDQTDMPNVGGADDYAKLPSGAYYVDPEGRIRQKR